MQSRAFSSRSPGFAPRCRFSPVYEETSVCFQRLTVDRSSNPAAVVTKAMRANSPSPCQSGRQSASRRAAMACALGVVLTSAPAEAARHNVRVHDACPNTLRDYLPVSGRDAALIVDGQSGQVLYARNAAAERHPASLTKMMTLYLLFDALKSHRISLASHVTISRHAAAQLKVNLNLSPGMTMSVETAIKAIVVRSANDVAVAIAEAVGGTEGHFAQLM